MPIKSELFDTFVKKTGKSRDTIVSQADASWIPVDRSKDEVQIVREYLTRKNAGVDYLNLHLGNLLQPEYELKFASIFIHKKPIIQRDPSEVLLCNGDRPGCEMGDLCVVFCLMDVNKKPIYKSSVIIQAKLDDNLNSISQRCLYDSDIKFHMPSNVLAISINKNSLRVLPSYLEQRVNALKYLILRTSPYPQLRTVPSTSGTYYDWGLLIGDMLTGFDGKPFDTPSVADCDWNMIMHDLFNIGS